MEIETKKHQVMADESLDEEQQSFGEPADASIIIDNDDDDDDDAVNCTPLSPLERLNDDCLLNLYEFLLPPDVTNLASISRRLEEFAAKNIYKKFAVLELVPRTTNSPISLTTFQTMMTHFGHRIESLRLDANVLIDGNRWQCLYCVLRTCSQLHTLQLANFVGDVPSQFFKLCRIRLERLTVIELNGCDGITDQWHTILTCWSQQYRSATIINNSHIRGDLLFECKQLESLSIIKCRHVGERELTTICQNNASTLRSLRLIKCFKLKNENVFRIIARTLQCLESISFYPVFKIYNEHRIDELTDMEHLRRIQIGQLELVPTLNSFNDTHVEELEIIDSYFDEGAYEAIKNFQRLHTLRIRSMRNSEALLLIEAIASLPELREVELKCCGSLTDANVVEIFRCCPKMELFDVTKCERVSFDAIREICEMLLEESVQQQQHQQHRPMLQFNFDAAVGVVTDENKKYLAQYRHLFSLTQIKWNPEDFFIFDIKDMLKSDSDVEDCYSELYGYF